MQVLVYKAYRNARMYTAILTDVKDGEIVHSHTVINRSPTFFHLSSV